MKNVLRVLKRDILRLLKVPPAMVVILALLVLPSLYTWYNVLGFWDPYENTGDLRVCVVNEDAGAASDLTGRIDVGQMIVDELHENHQLDWQFPDRDEAMDQLYAGESYAVFVIPESFSADLLTLTTGDFHKPDIEYYVNEKIGPVSPKITDTGANTLDATVNAAFVETVSAKATEALDAAADEAQDRMAAARSVASAKVAQAKERLQSAGASIAGLADQAERAKGRAASSKDSLGTARDAIAHASDAMSSIADASANLQGDYLKFSADAVPALTGAMKDAADAYAEAARLIGELPAQTDETRALLERLRASADKAQADADRYSQILADDVAPAVSEGLGTMASASATAAGAIAGQKVVIGQAEAVLDDMSSTLSAASGALKETQGLLDGLAADVEHVETDALMLAGSDVLTRIVGKDGLDAQKVAGFISAPTRLMTEQLYPLNAYGTAMAPLFMNLTFWIGAFMLMVVLRQEVDAEGIRRLTLSQRYLSRYLLLAMIVVLQAIICCAGLPFIGVQAVNMPALFFAAVVASLAYLSIIYALSVTFQHIGKGVCIILVFAQIPAATGLYPIEMTSPFFQGIYPALPFTYGISAMRESICGFYGAQYAIDMLVLAAFLLGAMAVGLLVRPLMSNVNRMVARQIKQSGIFNGEDVEVPVRRYRMSQVLRVLSDRTEYREAIISRYERFQRMYPWLIRGAVALGIVVPVAFTVAFSLGVTGKVILLTVWLCWIFLVFTFLIVVESLRSSFERQMRLDGMSDEELRGLYLHRDRTEHADAAGTLSAVCEAGDADGTAGSADEDANPRGGERHA